MVEHDVETMLVLYYLKDPCYNNEWLQGLYSIRESLIPVYNRSDFFAGMNAIQRSEKFVLKFEKALDSRLQAEKREDYENKHTSRRFTTCQNLRCMMDLSIQEIYFVNFTMSLRRSINLEKRRLKEKDDGARMIMEDDAL
ncbi:hypothetical protein MTR_3g020080 [Medicago truncatula]|uniref:Protein FAR1-RELATED SEQUENCE n=1 Tax=Medicago truncatula TaxID=3880 RepID=G7IZ09_MEDTR|nr:hypothetical protein MTR_3g020080 [Medicago truncatula]